MNQIYEILTSSAQRRLVWITSIENVCCIICYLQQYAITSLIGIENNEIE